MSMLMMLISKVLLEKHRNHCKDAGCRGKGLLIYFYNSNKTGILQSKKENLITNSLKEQVIYETGNQH